MIPRVIATSSSTSTTTGRSPNRSVMIVIVKILLVVIAFVFFFFVNILQGTIIIIILVTTFVLEAIFLPVRRAFASQRSMLSLTGAVVSNAQFLVRGQTGQTANHRRFFGHAGSHGRCFRNFVVMVVVVLVVVQVVAIFEHHVGFVVVVSWIVVGRSATAASKIIRIAVAEFLHVQNLVVVVVVAAAVAVVVLVAIILLVNPVPVLA
mmetsp:Transcript_25375/g.59469  ORF Transcript_25375/g.59469 Transcript_25375/m.59469 type:complete len:207 (+) Transcript_25375:1724-2344(+)